MPTETIESIPVHQILRAQTVKSVWATTPPITQAAFSETAWAGASVMPIPEGFLMVKNDHNFLYLLLDLTKDTGKSPGVGDYFWLTFDVDRNACITPNRDVNYGIYPSLPIRIGKQFYLGPGTWTGISQQPTKSLARQEFGRTPHSMTPHRVWELRIDLKEIGVNLTHVTLPPVLHFGLRVSSATPAFTCDFPPDFYMNFSDLPVILMAVNAPLPSIGKPVVGIGLIPVGTGAPSTDGIDPATGRATTSSTYYLPTKNTAFGGVLNLIGDQTVLQSLWNQNVRKYCVKFKGAQTPLVPIWTNYHFMNNQWVYENIVPDSDGFYALIDPRETYSIDHLLFQWNTVGVSTGTHDLEIDFVNQSGTVVDTQTLRLMVDNNQPEVEIYEIKYNNKTVQPCDIVNIVPGGGTVNIHYRAYDAESDMRVFGLGAYHGEGKYDEILAETVPADPHGVADASVAAAPKFPPETCAYEFRLWAYSNVVNGYSFLGYTEATEHVTLIVPTAAPYKVLATKPTFPSGLKSVDGRTGAIGK